MRDIDDQLRDVRDRSKKIIKQRRRRRAAAAYAVSACACIVILAALSLSISSFTLSDGSATSMYGSLILTAPHLGYAVVGVLAFILGICFAFVCVRIRNGANR
ncbi:MAG: hypothetical protein K6F67_08105 [Oscillospiraceae bacterium]|nr:hypothetical protein [Oscillospiraceae bacterium]